MIQTALKHLVLTKSEGFTAVYIATTIENFSLFYVLISEASSDVRQVVLGIE